MKWLIKLTLLLTSSCLTSVVAQQRPIDQEFLEAVQKKDVPQINLLLKRGANINAQEPINGHFALQYAINWPDVSLVKLLLDKGANANLLDKIGNSALTDAAGRGGPENAAIVKLLIDRGANIHVNNDEAILDAAREADAEVVRLLLAKGAPANARNKERERNTVLMEAASGGSVENVRMILAAGADLRATNDEGQTALMKAVRLDHRYKPEQRLPMIDLLISKGADVNQADKYGSTPLLHSVWQYMSEAGGIISHPEVVRLLLERGANVQAMDERGDTALIVSAGVWRGNIEIVRLLLDKGINLNAQNKKGSTAVMVATEDGRVDVVTLLVEKGADLNLTNVDGARALDIAIENGHPEIAKLLHTKRARSLTEYPNEAALTRAVTNFALLRSASRNNLNEVKQYIAAGADLNSRSGQGQTALMLAIENSYGRNDVAQLLIEQGADVNAVDNKGNSALMFASDRNNVEAVKLLLANKAAVYLFNKDRRRALHIAAAGLHRQIVEVLLLSKPEVSVSSAGADLRGVEVNGLDSNGRTPLMLAAEKGGYVPDEVMQLLLSNGAQIDAQDTKGFTALMIATQAGGLSGVEFLLKKGASVNLKNNEGQTALKLARTIHENKNVSNSAMVEQRVVAMLLRAGAQE